MNLTIEINLSNFTTDPQAQTARVLRQCADQLAQLSLTTYLEEALMDPSGVQVGTLRFDPEEA